MEPAIPKSTRVATVFTQECASGAQPKTAAIVRDIFGNPVDLEALARAPLVGRKKRMEPIPSGHVFTKGTGPEGETCGSCKHLFRNQMAKTYLKCGLNRANWTGGRKSDVRARDAACKYWEAP